MFKNLQKLTWANVWGRVTDRDKPPRRWWYPETPAAPTLKPDAKIDKLYENCVDTLRNTMLALLAFCMFCAVTVFATPDAALIGSTARVKLPLADVEIVFLGFLLAAPFLLIVLTLYLHIFNNTRIQLERGYDFSDLRPLALFTIGRPISGLLTDFIFFWLVPIILATITWKAFGQIAWGRPLLLVTAVVAVCLLWTQIRRCATARLPKNGVRWVALFAIVALAGFGSWDAEKFRRPLNLFRADLKGEWLEGVDLRDAQMRYATLPGANLKSARLQKADLRGADLTGAQLTGALMQGANLAAAKMQGAKLQRAMLKSADLEGADLARSDFSNADVEEADLATARLQGANLESANLMGARLRGALLSAGRLRGARLQGAQLDGAQLGVADLEGANLTAADLRGSHLLGANLARADMSGASLRGANLRGTNLEGAQLDGVDLRGAKIWYTVAPKEEALRYADTTGIVVAPASQSGQSALETMIGDLRDEELQKSLDKRLAPVLAAEKAWESSPDRQKWVLYEKRTKPDSAGLAEHLVLLACADSHNNALLMSKIIAHRVDASAAPTGPFRDVFSVVESMAMLRTILEWSTVSGRLKGIGSSNVDPAAFLAKLETCPVANRIAAPIVAVLKQTADQYIKKREALKAKAAAPQAPPGANPDKPVGSPATAPAPSPKGR